MNPISTKSKKNTFSLKEDQITARPSQVLLLPFKVFITLVGFFLSVLTFATNIDPSVNPIATDQNGDYPRWPQNTFEWIYHASNEPEWLEPNQGLELFKNAALAWKDCGITIKFNAVKEAQSEVKLGDQVNSFGWGQLPLSTRAITYRAMVKNSPFIKESDILVNTNNRDIQKNPILLQKVISHEFGHALGLLHPLSCDDVMSNASDCGKKIANPPPLLPTKNDLLQCKVRYNP